jgi:hypothetical protein
MLLGVFEGNGLVGAVARPFTPELLAGEMMLASQSGTEQPYLGKFYSGRQASFELELHLNSSDMVTGTLRDLDFDANSRPMPYSALPVDIRNAVEARLKELRETHWAPPPGMLSGRTPPPQP